MSDIRGAPLGSDARGKKGAEGGRVSGVFERNICLSVFVI